MSRMAFNLVLLTGFGAALFTMRGLATAQQGNEKKEPQKIVKTSETTKATELLFSAYQLAAYGEKNNAPEALLTAARIIGTSTPQKIKPEDIKTDGKVENVDTLKEANAMIDKALQMKTTNPEAVTALANEVRKVIVERPKGAIPGPRTINGSVSGGDRRDTFSITFRGGEYAVVRVNNLTNRGDIDLYIQDDNGNIIARDRSLNDDAQVSFPVQRTQTYQVIVHCYASSGFTLNYRLTTN